jgi:Uma2 family endonuclease
MALIKPVFSYEHLAQMPDDGKRYEILEGDLIVSPSPNRKHQRIVGRLFNFLSRAEQAGYGEAYVAPFDVVFDPHNAPQPDVFFVSRDRLAIVTDDNVQGAPDLIVEVLSKSTRERDLGAKLRLYARHGVRFYWVVDPDAETLQPYTLQEEGYREEPALRAGATLVCPLFPGVELAVAEVFAS